MTGSIIRKGFYRHIITKDGKKKRIYVKPIICQRGEILRKSHIRRRVNNDGTIKRVKIKSSCIKDRGRKGK